MATISQSDYNKIVSQAAEKWYSQSQVDSLAKSWGYSAYITITWIVENII